ncbi:MAG: OmpA family protein [Polyangiaceae bacterium]
MHVTRARRFLIAANLGLLLGASTLTSACGYSEDEWQAQLAKYRGLQDSSAKKQKELEGELADARTTIGDLTKKLQDMGVDVSNLKASLDAKGSQLDQMQLTLEQQQKALADYKAKAAQLEAIKARFETLKKKLDELTKLGLAVTIRNNRMVISLPGDVLFDSGAETLKREGKDILTKVATVIKNDSALVQRQYQVAGHTDSKPYAGTFRDNWGLSLMRAREVLLYLVDDEGLPAAKWSAAGFGATDPVADNSSTDGRQKNRRCDLIVVPSVEEMLDLKSIAN